MVKRRRWGAKEKLQIVLEGLGAEGAIADLCRRRGITPTQFYTWRRQLTGAADRIFDRPRGKANGKEARLEVEVARLRGVIAEITLENLELKKTFGD